MKSTASKPSTSTRNLSMTPKGTCSNSSLTFSSSQGKCRPRKAAKKKSRRRIHPARSIRFAAPIWNSMISATSPTSNHRSRDTLLSRIPIQLSTAATKLSQTLDTTRATRENHATATKIWSLTKAQSVSSQLATNHPTETSTRDLAPKASVIIVE